TLVGQIDPTMRGHLVLARLRIGPLDGADVPAIGCFGIRGAKRKSSLEVGPCRLPIDRIVEIDAVSCIARSEANGLYKSGAFGLPGNFERDAHRTILTDANLWGPTDKRHVSQEDNLAVLPLRRSLLPVGTIDAHRFRSGGKDNCSLDQILANNV